MDHQTGDQVYFKRQLNQPITAAGNYGNPASAFGLWDYMGVVDGFSYSCWSAMIRFTPAFLFPGSSTIVTRGAAIGAATRPRLTSAQQLIMVPVL